MSWALGVKFDTYDCLVWSVGLVYAGRHHIGKVVYTDYEEVLIWYECEVLDVTGACSFGRSTLEILQRSPNANGNLYLVHRDLVRSLCVDPKLLELVSHHGNFRTLPDILAASPAPAKRLLVQACRSVGRSVCPVNFGRMAKAIMMPFGVVGLAGTRHHVSDLTGLQIHHGEGKVFCRGFLVYTLLVVQHSRSFSKLAVLTATSALYIGTSSETSLLTRNYSNLTRSMVISLSFKTVGYLRALVALVSFPTHFRRY